MDATIAVRIPAEVHGLTADSMRFLRLMESCRREESAPSVACPTRIGPSGVAFDIVLRRMTADSALPSTTTTEGDRR